MTHMDASKVKETVDAHIEPLMRAVGVPHWRITVDYEPLPEGSVAEIDFQSVDYWRAFITFDPAKCTDEDHVIRCLLHEILHILAAPFVVYRNVMRAGMDAESPEGEREDRLWCYAMEQQVVMLERGLAADLRKADTDTPPVTAGGDP